MGRVARLVNGSWCDREGATYSNIFVPGTRLKDDLTPSSITNIGASTGYSFEYIRQNVLHLLSLNFQANLLRTT